MSRVTDRRLHLWIVLAVSVGVTTGLVVALLHLLIHTLAWHPISLRDDWWVSLLPLVGLAVSWGLVSRTRSRSTATTEEFIRSFHDPGRPMPLREVPVRLLGSIATIASGGSMGLEGPSIFAGAAIGDAVERRYPTLLRKQHAQVLLVAGAAAGVAAIFKAPLTGIVFALEVPYQDELARHALIPAVFAATSSYLVFVSLVGTEPFFPLSAAPLSRSDLLVSVGVGVACGIGARLFTWIFHAAADVAARITDWLRPLVGGTILAVIGFISIRAFGLPLALGPGYNGMLFAARGQLSIGLLLLLLLLKLVATSTTAAAGGVGGLFFPSAMMGAVLGSAIGQVVPGPGPLFAVVGIAAFLSSAYNVPLAGAAFVAETTGAPGYVIPGLLAAAIAYLVSGRRSLSESQRSRGASQDDSN